MFELVCTNCAEAWNALYVISDGRELFDLEDGVIVRCPNCPLHHELSLIDISRIRLAKQTKISDDLKEIILTHHFQHDRALGIASVCCVCKKVRDKDGYIPFKEYARRRGVEYIGGSVEERLLTKFEQNSSHGFCPECFSIQRANTIKSMEKQYGQYS